jgi:hypothetical protein
VTTTAESPWSNPAAPAFETSPLLTLSRIHKNPKDAFAVTPKWVRQLVVIHPDDAYREYDPVTPMVLVVTGHKLLSFRGYSAINFALLCEITRLPGISITTNSNGTGRSYARITIADAGEDLTSVNRFLWGASAYDQIVVNGLNLTDARPENLRADPAAKVGKDARAILLGHAERISKQWEERGGMPGHFTRQEYLDNLRSLIEATDLEASGIAVDFGAGS